MKRKPPRQWIPDRPDPRGAAPASIGELLLDTAAFAAERSGRAIPREEWRRIVGPRIAARTRVGKLFKGVLTVHVASSAWSNELSLLKSDLLARLQRAGREVSDLRFRVDPGEAPSASEQRAARMRRAARPSPEVAAPRTELPAELQRRLALIEDPTLRAAIADAARASLGVPRSG